MKRHDRLVDLSREHHAALSLARRLRMAPASPGAATEAVAAVEKLRIDLEFHFDEEEVRLLPVLWRCGRSDLAERLCAEHVELRSLLAQAVQGRALDCLGRLLESHVRFEEREMFPFLEKYWNADRDCDGRGDPAFDRDAPVWMGGRAAMHGVNLGGY